MRQWVDATIRTFHKSNKIFGVFWERRRIREVEDETSNVCSVNLDAKVDRTARNDGIGIAGVAYWL